MGLAGRRDREKHRISRSWLTLFQDAILDGQFGLVVTGWLLAYVAIGLIFFGLYMLGPGKLNPPSGEALTWQTVMSFSFVTQATIGYGDVTPRGWFQLFANLQAVSGTALNGAALGIITLRIIKRKPPLRIPRKIAFFCTSEDGRAFRLRYLSMDTADLVDVHVSVFFTADARASNPLYDAVGGEVGSMHMLTVPPGLVVALTIPCRPSAVPLRKPGSEAMRNDATISLNPYMFRLSDGSVDPSARLLLRIQGFHSSTGAMFALSNNYWAKDIVCAPFHEIDNNEQSRLTKAEATEVVRERFEAFTGKAHFGCAAPCPFAPTIAAVELPPQADSDGAGLAEAAHRILPHVATG